MSFTRLCALFVGGNSILSTNYSETVGNSRTEASPSSRAFRYNTKPSCAFNVEKYGCKVQIGFQIAENRGEKLTKIIVPCNTGQYTFVLQLT